jgi:hypothetical protein
MLVLSFFGLGQPLLFILAQQILYPDWKRRIRSFPILLLIAIGMAPSNSWAVMKALAGRDFTFLRTPKGEALTYRLSPDRMLAVEIVLAFYAGITLALAISLGKFGSTAFLASCLLGLGYMIILTIAQILPRWHHQPAYQE